MRVVSAAVASCPGLVLVGRPGSPVVHAYVGVLSPSGRWVSRGGRAVCRARTRRLGVMGDPSTRALNPLGRRLCARCAVVLGLGTPGAAAHHTHARLADACAGVTGFDLAVDAWHAITPAEVEFLELVALVVVGWPAVHSTPVVSPAGKSSPPLWRQLSRARRRVGCPVEISPLAAAAEENRAAAAAAVESRRREAAAEWHARYIDRGVPRPA